MRVSHIIKETRSFTAELALLIERAFSQSSQYQLNLKATHDLLITVAGLGILYLMHTTRT